MDETKCACGKIKTLMNLTNWNRHLKACKLKNLKKTQDIKSFFSPHLNKYLLYFYLHNFTLFLTEILVSITC